MQVRHWALGAALISIAPYATSSGAGATLTAAQIISQVIGNTIRYQNDEKDVVNEYFSADGTVHGRSKSGGDYSAVWQIRFGDQLCIVQSDPMQSGCIGIVIRGNKIEYHRRDGVVEGPFELRPGNPEHL